MDAGYFKNHDFLTWTRQHPWHHAALSSITLDNGTQVDVWDSGVIVFTPAKLDEADLDLVLSCGVHGNETAPIEICQQLVQAIYAGELDVRQRVMFLFANPASMDIAERFVEENMNRLFSGAHSEGGITNPERQRAANLEQYVERFFTALPDAEQRSRRHYDLHTAIRGSKNEKFVVYPFRHGKPWKMQELSLLLSCGVSTVLLSHAPTTTFSYFSSNEFGADAFTVELGQVKPFGQNDMRRFEATKQTLWRMIANQDQHLPAFDESNFQIYQVNRAINRTVEDFELNFADDVQNFTDFPKGHVLARDGETLYHAEVDGEAIIFPNANVALGQRALLTVVPTELGEKI